MDYSFWDFLTFLGSLGIFIYGMKIMSEGLQKAAGNSLRKILSGMTSNRFMGVITGIIVTSLIQSSSATTVMVVSFVNAGLLTLTESMGVIMGANIGTTVTAWLILIFGFKVKIKAIAIIIIGVSFPMLFAKNNNLKNIAEFILGFGILFIGLDFLKDSVPDMEKNYKLLEFLNHWSDMGYGSIIIFVIVGTLLTVIIQSSSATMAVTLILVAQGWITFEIAAAMVLGENIGTTITANLAALVGNVHAKRAARFHSVFNIVGVFWMLIVFYLFIDMADHLQNLFTGSDTSVHAPHEPFMAMTNDKLTEAQIAAKNARINATTLGLSLFHTTFNIINVILIFGFVPLIQRLVIKITPSRGGTDERFQLRYIGTGLMSTPELSIAEARKESQLMGRLVEKMFSQIIILLYKEPKNFNKMMEKVANREEITDRIQLEIANYLTKVSEADLSESASKRLRSILRVTNDLERMGDIIIQMSKNVERMRSEKVLFPEEIKSELEELFDYVYNFVKFMNTNLDADPETVQLEKVYEMERKVNSMRDEFQARHFARIEKSKYSVQDGLIFMNLINLAEKVGDHVVNVNEAIASSK